MKTIREMIREAADYSAGNVLQSTSVGDTIERSLAIGVERDTNPRTLKVTLEIGHAGTKTDQEAALKTLLAFL